MDITNQAKALTTQDLGISRTTSVNNNNNTPDKAVEAIKAAPVVNETRQEPTEAVLASAVSEINDYVQNIQRSLQFTVDEASGKDVVTVLDKDTEEVIRQFPSDEVLAIARQLAEQKGDDLIQLFNSKA